ncbi:efflux RND transporter periplasmic adaptor subunit [Nodularia sphaerocarpa]|uniref:efflux RND transporter periplasmic adaptor subunit n=1 Tax=Nodularia sphaerocarpa TaxID=137816 RepID=UPI001EFC0B4C|nr:efflux RND transporter periplasmic adaptor subunit [Nodularia sphaerocarpa]MDB9373393.1 efflux RND transporter periplasmic adaptor subunit [Nodularia sphaerocarpa CS-585]MDB9379390.1 efflux RND transporter periplasmic adaptor subunit [Nodularia sphaerocarpa CS-585A2]ULP71386.1 Multidrug resistance protein MdtA [Nodularia sphaerocarpa UHCC 0038]
MKNFKFKPGFKWLTISASLTVVSLGGWLIFAIFTQSKTQTIPVRMTIVSQDKVEDKITGESGIIKLDNQRNIKSPITGTVEQVLVKLGDSVKKGQTLIRLRDTESQIKLQEFASDLNEKNLQLLDKQLSVQRVKKKLLEKQQEYKDMQKTYQLDIDKKKQEILWELEKRKLEITKKQQTLTAKKEELEEAKVKLEENKQLIERGFISGIELKDQEKKVTQTEIDLTNAQDDLYLSNIDFKKQQLDLESFLQDIKNNKAEPQQKLQEYQAKVEQAQEEVDQAQLGLNQLMRELEKLKLQRQKITEDLRKTLITSPIDGTIFNLKAKLGDVIEANADVLVIGDSVEKIVELKLSPLDATRVKVRQNAEISIVGFQAQKLTGKVEQISLLAGDSQNENQGTDNVKVTAIVRLDKNNENILAGTPVTVALIISQRDNVLAIPSEAIQQNESETFVWMRDKESKAFQRIITTGLEGLENVEVKSGLKPGDEILIPFWETPLNVGDSVVIKMQ